MTLVLKILLVWTGIAVLTAPVVIRLFRFSSAPETPNDGGSRT